MNWGLRITLLYVGFVVLILSLVFAASRQEYHLVTEDYYGEELQHADHMQRIRNTEALPQGLVITYKGGDELLLGFPEGMSPLKGELKLYRPSDSRLDTQFDLEPDAQNQQKFQVGELQHGLWRLQVEWDAHGQGYYHEQSIVLQ